VTCSGRPRLLALYLPQFHAIPENDANWGPGFTEWTHVAESRPLYPGHQQPKVPSELGFYDLRLPDVQIDQAALAAEHGIEGFCYWHYWFAGRRVLERPGRQMLESGQPDYPFCIAWANASWTGIWYGAPDRILIEQTYPGEDDHRAHFNAVLPMLRDPRYIKVGEDPLVVIWEPLKIPESERFVALWRDLAAKAGLPGLHLVGFGTSDFDPHAHGYDASTLHGPQLPRPLGGRSGQRRLWQRALGMPAVSSYRAFVRRGLPETRSSLEYPVALPNWDNTPRSGRRGSVLQGSTPELFREHLRQAIDAVDDRPDEQRIVFLKSWNEWAEGNYLEPDRRFGRAYLEVIREEVDRATRLPA